jgi:hypothetical protein
MVLDIGVVTLRTMKSSDIAPLRMHSQRLWGAPFDTPQEVVGWLGAVQGQDYLVAKWSLAQRTKGVTGTAIDQALAAGSILRTHLLRPTWHFVTSADIRWILGLTAPRVHAQNAHYYQRAELDERFLAKTNSLLAKALEGGVQLTRKEVAAVLERSGVIASGPRLAYILMHAELDAVVCSGGLRGKQQTYASLDERAPKTKPFDREKALAELTKRYFISRGPATAKDYARWSGLTVVDAKVGLEMVGSLLEHEAVDDRDYWFAPTSQPTKRTTRVVDLVQGLDECIISYSHSRDALRPVPPTHGEPTVFAHAILLDGRLIGHWRREFDKKTVVIEASLYRPLDRTEIRALEAAVERYGSFEGAPTRLILTE